MTSSSPVHIFFVGATGYIGGEVLPLLIKSPKTSSITALVRSEDKAALLHKRHSSDKLKTVIGDFEDVDLLKEESAKADIVLQVANCDTPSLVEAIVDGLRARSRATGIAPLLIHTSGAANLADTSRGEHGNFKVYSDLDVEALEALPPTNPHRNVDELVVAADAIKEDPIRTIIISPPLVYGISSALHPMSIQIPTLIRFALKFGHAVRLGSGNNAWSSVHVHDLAHAYLIIFNASLEGKITTGRNGYYFTDGGKFFWKDLVDAIGKSLHSRGVISTSSAGPLPASFIEEVGPFVYFGFGSNSVYRGDRTRALGWSPKEDNVYDVEKDVDYVLSESSK